MLTVVTMIVLLATVATVRLNIARQKAQYAKAKFDIIKLIDFVRAARLESGKTFAQITGENLLDFCTECSCQGKGNIQKLPKTDSCWIDYLNSFNKLNNVPGNTIKINLLPTDPWGGPYLFNETKVGAVVSPTISHPQGQTGSIMTLTT